MDILELHMQSKLVLIFLTITLKPIEEKLRNGVVKGLKHVLISVPNKLLF